jgi:hypothetical protein
MKAFQTNFNLLPESLMSIYLLFEKHMNPKKVSSNSQPNFHPNFKTNSIEKAKIKTLQSGKKP